MYFPSRLSFFQPLKTRIMLLHSTLPMAVLSVIVSIMAVSSVALPSPNEFPASINDALTSPLNADRALSVVDVNTYITKQISSMQGVKDVTKVQTQLTTNLQGTYGNKINWLVYVAQDFKPRQENVSINYFGKGITSNVIVGAWTVYWAATPAAPTDAQRMVANQDVIQSQLSSCSSTVKGPFTAPMVYKCLESSPKPVTSGRNPIAKFIFTSSNPGPNTSIGNSPGLTVSSLRVIIKIKIGPVVIIIIIY